MQTVVNKKIDKKLDSHVNELKKSKAEILEEALDVYQNLVKEDISKLFNAFEIAAAQDLKEFEERI